MLAGCATVDLSVPLSGRFMLSPSAVKNFTVIGTVTASSQEIHTISPFGIVRKVEGSKITYSDLMLEATVMDADDIIDVRIDCNTGGSTGFFDWLKGRNRTFTYTGKALAVKYISKNEAAPEPEKIDFFRR